MGGKGTIVLKQKANNPASFGKNTNSTVDKEFRILTLGHFQTFEPPNV